MANRTLLALSATAALCASTSVFSQSEDSPVIATVNGESITVMDRQTQNEQFVARGQQATQEQVLDELVSLELMRQEAIKQGLDKSPRMESEMKIMRARVLANTLLNEFTSTVDLSDEALREEYERQVEQAKVFEFNASHILLEDEAKAKEIITELDGGADFAETAKKYSTGPSGANGGDLGWFEAGAMVPEFSAAAAELEIGKYSAAPVKTEFGFHIIKLADKRAVAPQPFDVVKDQVQGIVMRNKVAEYVDGLHEAAEIEIK